MAPILFRDLPGIAEVERQLTLHARDCLLDDEIEELPVLVDDISRSLFGITQQDTFYWALPASVRARFSRSDWDEQFDLLGHCTRDPNAHWAAFDLDLRCDEGSSLNCLEVFGRQLVCALHGLHPKAILAFADRRAPQAA